MDNRWWMVVATFSSSCSAPRMFSSSRLANMPRLGRARRSCSSNCPLYPHHWPVIRLHTLLVYASLPFLDSAKSFRRQSPSHAPYHYSEHDFCSLPATPFTPSLKFTITKHIRKSAQISRGNHTIQTTEKSLSPRFPGLWQIIQKCALSVCLRSTPL